MVGKDAGFVKTTRIKQIKKEMAKGISKGINKESLLDMVEMDIGLSRSKATEYIDLIVRASGWVELGGKIVCSVT